ncbi:MAG: ferredoxin reductase [Chitinophagaceae bacterium]|nr:ferredoxin reductase [Chitinophagaceae bacterium]
MENIVKILSVINVTHNVKCFRLSKPKGYRFEPGQATEVSIKKPGWEEERRPFTFTSLNAWDYLEFTIKIYTDHPGVTNELNKLVVGDELIIRDVWGAIAYQGEGYFIAGGAGITPFIAILRQLHNDNLIKSNQLFFSNKTAQDIILHNELDNILRSGAHYILTKEDNPLYTTGFINKDFLLTRITDFTKPFYICGPDKMVADISTIVAELGASSEQVIFEK